MSKLTENTTVRAKYYGTQNCEQATGLTYRFVRDQARALGVKVYRLSAGRRLVVDADDFDQKLQALAEARDASADSAGTAAELAAQLGLVVRG